MGIWHSFLWGSFADGVMMVIALVVMWLCMVGVCDGSCDGLIIYMFGYCMMHLGWEINLSNVQDVTMALWLSG